MGQEGDEHELVAAIVREVLTAHPVRLGVLFGSQARGTAGTHSDIDVAVEFEPSVENRFRARLAVGVALTRALGTDDVDVVDLETVQPAVGYAALTSGRLLVGDSDRAASLAKEFDSEREQTTPEERRQRFDDTLARLEELVG